MPRKKPSTKPEQDRVIAPSLVYELRVAANSVTTLAFRKHGYWCVPTGALESLDAALKGTYAPK